jgi:hypothetical protein
MNVPPRDGPHIPPAELPEVVRRYLVRHDYVVLTTRQYQELHDEARARRDEACPYPLHRDPWGHYHHGRYVGRILQDELDVGSGLSVIQCEACRNVTFETPVAIG